MIKKIYSLIWKRWLWNDFHKQHDKVIEVLGWRTARTETKSGSRQISTPCFKLFGINFD